jgi:photosystem I reaction center subunit XII
VQSVTVSGKVIEEHVVVEDAFMALSDTQVFVAMVVALLPLAMAVRLGLALYK